eukprot:scpid39140/ scgid24612/ 
MQQVGGAAEGQAAAAQVHVADAGEGQAADAAAAAADTPTRSCGCTKNCLSKFPSSEVDDFQLTMRGLEKAEKDMLLMGVLLSAEYPRSDAQRGKRRRAAFDYSFRGEVVCAGAFRQIYDVSQRVLKNILNHLKNCGPVPRINRNTGRRPHNALTFNVVKVCADFLKQYAEEFGLPFPAPVHGRADRPPIFLPSSQSKKVCAQVVCGGMLRAECASCQEDSIQRHLEGAVPTHKVYDCTDRCMQQL